MVNNRGVVLIFALLLTLVLSSLLVALYLNAVSESLQANRHASSLRAFWLAEAGIATVKANPGLASASGTLGGINYAFSVTSPELVAGTSNYWIVTSTGTVTLPRLPSDLMISRTVVATIKTGDIDPSKFPYSIDTTVDLVVRGVAATIDEPFKENDDTINFANMFGVSKTTMEAGATHVYTDSNFENAPVDGITWVNVASGNTLVIAGELVGSGILVVNGDVHMSGTVDFSGIIYVIGSLMMTGNVTTNGSVVAESSATADTEVRGSVDINYDLSQIESALANVQLLSKQVVTWREQ
jgi:hypothetical protein